jgi:hypothetical protein
LGGKVKVARIVVAFVASVVMVVGVAAGTAAADPPEMTHNTIVPEMTHN